MKNKKIIIGLMSLVFLVPLGFAQITQDDLDKAGVITADSPLHPLELFFDDVRVALTSDPIAQAQLLDQITIERSAEAKIAIDSGNAQVAIQAIDDYSDAVAQTSEAVSSVDSSSDNSNIQQTAQVDKQITSDIQTADNNFNSEISSSQTIDQSVQQENKAVATDDNNAVQTDIAVSSTESSEASGQTSITSDASTSSSDSGGASGE